LEWIENCAARLANELNLIIPSLGVASVDTLEHSDLRWLEGFVIEDWLDASLEVKNLV